jgi:hypothetical protein
MNRPRTLGELLSPPFFERIGGIIFVGVKIERLPALAFTPATISVPQDFDTFRHDFLGKLAVGKLFPDPAFGEIKSKGKRWRFGIDGASIYLNFELL